MCFWNLPTKVRTDGRSVSEIKFPTLTFGQKKEKHCGHTFVVVPAPLCMLSHCLVNWEPDWESTVMESERGNSCPSVLSRDTGYLLHITLSRLLNQSSEPGNQIPRNCRHIAPHFSGDSKPGTPRKLGRCLSSGLWEDRRHLWDSFAQTFALCRNSSWWACICHNLILSELVEIVFRLECCFVSNGIWTDWRRCEMDFGAK